MRRLTLLLFLMMVAAFRWSIGSAEASTTTEQNDAVLPRTHITLEAVNTGFEDTAVAASIHATDTVWIMQELLSAAIGLGPHSINAIHSRSNLRVVFKLVEIVAGRMIEDLPPVSDRA